MYHADLVVDLLRRGEKLKQDPENDKCLLLGLSLVPVFVSNIAFILENLLCGRSTCKSMKTQK